MKFRFDFFISNFTYKIILSVVSFSFPFLFFLKMGFWLSFPTFDANPCPDISVECCWQVFVCHSFPFYVLDLMYRSWRCRANIFEIWFCLSFNICFKVVSSSNFCKTHHSFELFDFKMTIWNFLFLLFTSKCSLLVALVKGSITILKVLIEIYLFLLNFV